MKDFSNQFPVKKMSEVFKVSRSGYYKWRSLAPIRRNKQEELDRFIKLAYKASRSTYGSPRVYDALKKDSIQTSKSAVARRMKALQIRARRKKRYRNTTNSNHERAISPDLLKRAFKVNELGKVWVSDITYIVLEQGFAYLTTVIDLANRMVVGWSLSDNMTDEDTTIAAFEKAIKNRGIKTGLIFHSDRGSQYASTKFRAILKANHCIQSMSRKGNCWDNAVAESFFKTIKIEELYNHKFKSIEQVFSVVFDYIDGWYNPKRIHSSLGGRSPLEMDEFLAA